MSPTLNDLMHRATEGHHPDLDALAHDARRRGLGIRRRRQALGLVGAAAATAVVLGGAQVVGGVVGDTGPAPRDQVAAAPDPIAGRGPVPASGAATASILVEALERVSDGSTSEPRGQGNGGGDTFAQVQWHPADGSGLSVVQVNVQPAFEETYLYECGATQQDCRVVERRDGSTVMSYDETDESTAGGDVYRVVDLLRPDGVRVVASEANGFDKPSNVFDVTRPQPSLTRAQLLRIVEDPAFGDPVDAAYTDPDRQVRGFVDLDETVDDGWFEEVPPASAETDPEG